MGQAKQSTTTQDYLGYHVYARTLWERIEAALNKDRGQPGALGDDPLVVGIFGEWGAGKSTLLKLVQAQAEAAARQAEQHKASELIVPVYFQPWKYEHEKHLLVPLVLHVVEATRQALQRAPSVKDQLVALAKEADSSVATITQAAHSSVKTARKWFPVLKKIAGSLSIFGVSIALPDEIDDWLSDAETVLSSPEAKEKQRVATARELRQKKLSFADNGFHYYELHQLLTSLTRPGKGEHTQDLATGAKANDLRINFVIFIDDLDRCLPEKAVETLELIKTVFNLESFAFVLALDEEVVERGIGHRYKDYALVNKKPEMPITGFEYLEKIVHLPFRLPALSRRQALNLLEHCEADLLQTMQIPGSDTYQPKPWFVQRPTHVQVELDGFAESGGDPTERRSRLLTSATKAMDQLLQGAQKQTTMHLGHAVLNGFDACVPRKLIRVVELFHQVAKVAHAQGKPIDEHLGGTSDPRWVLALVMMQLFQPDLYRFLRRSGRGLDVLRDSFLSRELRADMADVDLLAWACYHSQPVTDLQGAVRAIAAIQDDAGKRYPAQRLRLPIVERLLEHRAAQRHVFDPLKLLAGLLADSAQVPFASASTRVYFGVLGQSLDDDMLLSPLNVVSEMGLNDAQPQAGVEAGQAQKQHFALVDADKLFSTVTSAEPSERRAFTEALGLQPNHRLADEVIEYVVPRIQQWLGAAPTDKDQERERNHRLDRLRDGLLYLAPHLSRTARENLWSLTEYLLPEWEPEDAHRSVEDLQSAARRADLYSVLAADPRFDATRSYLPSRRFKGHGVDQEPIEGFVWVQRESGNFKPKVGKEVSLEPFLMARYPTTVDQYAAFIDDGGYKKSEWWGKVGWGLLTGKWGQDDAVPDWLRSRDYLAEHHCPEGWMARRCYGSLPVEGVTWFEARAYASWLNGQDWFRAKMTDAGLHGMRVGLPTEAQWERAARATGFDSPPDDREYVWVDTAVPAELRVNVRQSGLARASPVGLFPANPLGICDLNGNVWEWQSNLYSRYGLFPHRIAGGAAHPLDRLAALSRRRYLGGVRGGSWERAVEETASSNRTGIPPDLTIIGQGFRVVLSPAD